MTPLQCRPLSGNVWLSLLQITAYILGALQFTASGSALIYFTGSTVVFPGSAVINEVQVGESGVASPPGTPLEVTAAGSQRIVMQGGSYRNTPYGGVCVCVCCVCVCCVCVCCVCVCVCVCMCVCVSVVFH